MCNVAEYAKLRRRYYISMGYLNYIQTLINKGVWSFSSKEMTEYLGYPSKDKLRLLRKNGRLLTPVRGFHIIIPEEYMDTGRLPVERYIDALMKHYSRPYYVGLLTAASYYGASHQSPQSFQVITNYDKRNIQSGRNQILFYRKKNTAIIPTEKRNTATGYLNISTPEATFFDLIEFSRQVGGLDHVGVVISELVERILLPSLLETAQHYPDSHVQRASYILELLGFNKICNKLDKYFAQKNFIYTYLNPSGIKARINKHPRWKLFINQELEIDL